MMLPITAMNKIEGNALQKRFRPLLIFNTCIGILGFSLGAILLGFLQSMALYWLRFITGLLARFTLLVKCSVWCRGAGDSVFAHGSHLPPRHWQACQGREEGVG